MNTIEAIYNRKSIRKYTDQTISIEDKERILKAAMAGPCCVNAREWEFIIVDDKDVLTKLAGEKRFGPIVSGSAFTVIVVGDQKKFFSRAPEYWVIDGAIAAQNMILAAYDLGIGSCWLGQYPQMDKVEYIQEFFNLPESIIPHSMISFGYPAEEGVVKEKWEPEKIHYNQW